MRNYSELPDLISAEEVKGYFQEALKETQASPDDMADALYELAHRQWHSNEPIAADVKAGVEAWIKANWNLKGPELYVNQLLSIVATLQLDGVLPLLEQARNDAGLSEEVREEVEAALAEYAEPAEV